MRCNPSKSWLSWDGRHWRIEPVFSLALIDEIPCYAAKSMSLDASLQSACDMEVHLDLQRYLLVSVFNGMGFRQWFWVSKHAFPDRWHGFRCAVYCVPYERSFLGI